MDIHVLGAGSGMPSKNLNSSAVFVRTGQGAFLLDCGEGSSRALVNMDLEADELDAVIITHLHPDHVSGILLLIQMLYLARREKPLHLFLPERSTQFLALLRSCYTFPQKFSFQLLVHDIEELTGIFPAVLYLLNDHLSGYKEIVKQNNYDNQLKAYSIRINSPGGDFVYSSDIATSDSIRDLLSGAHTILVDAGHPEPEQILKLKNYGFSSILLTHEPKAELLSAIDFYPGSPFEIAQENKLYRIQ